MEKVLEALSGGGDVLGAIVAFNEENKERREFSDVDLVLRKKFMGEMIQLGIRDDLEEPLRSAALTALRFVLRERSETSELLTFERVFKLLLISGIVSPQFSLPENLEEKVQAILSEDDTFKYPSIEDDESCLEDEEKEKAQKEDNEKALHVAESLPALDKQVEDLGEPWKSPYSPALTAEAAKCIVNVITKHERGGAIIDALNILPHLLLQLKHRVFPKEARFAYLRLLLRMTFERVLKLRLFSSSVLNILADVLDWSLEDIENPAYSGDIEECLKVIFSISIPLGPLEGPKEPREDQYLAFKQMIKTFQSVLFLPKEPRYRRFKASTTQALINVPARCTELFDPEKTLEALIEVLYFQVDVAIADESRSAEALTPILLNLTSIAKAIPRARPILKMAIFPPEVFQIESQPSIQAHEILEKGDSLASKLMNFMTSFNMAVKHYVNNFFYIILEEDANELVRLIGFGRAAGLLATLKLFGMDKLAEAQTGRSSSGSSSSSS